MKTPMTRFQPRDPFAEVELHSHQQEEDGSNSSQAKALLRYTRIFARMKPDQKVFVLNRPNYSFSNDGE